MKKIIIGIVLIIAICGVGPVMFLMNQQDLYTRQDFASHMQGQLRYPQFKVSVEGFNGREIRVVSPMFYVDKSYVRTIFFMFHQISNLKGLGFTRLVLTDGNNIWTYEIE